MSKSYYKIHDVFHTQGHIKSILTNLKHATS